MPTLVDAGEDNPFHVKLEPIEGNPFQSDPYTAAQPPPNYHDPLGPVLTTMAQSALHRVMTPGEVVKGVEPARSEMVSDEDVARQLMLEKNAQTFGPDQAMAMIGAGIPMAERGAAGIAGGGAKVYYHGSPHDFDKFDIGKIGTGEGNQAYGHGLYFTERPEIAKQYRDALSNTSQTPAQSIAEEYFRRANNDPLAAQKLLSEHADMFGAKGQEAMEILKSGKGLNPGRMYEVNINADPEHFLDWDKPLSEQHPKVQPIIAEAVKNEAYNRALAATNKPRADELWAMVKDPNKAPAGFAQELLQKPEIVEKLREAGIPGIKYLDQGSRNTDQFRVSTEYRPEGDQYHVFDQKNKAHGTFDTKEAANAFAEQKNTEGQTHNYVVFHHDIVDILKKYGLAGLVGAGAAHFKTTPVDNNPFTAQQ